MYAFLSHDWSGIIIALIILLLGALLFRLAGERNHLGWLIKGVGGLFGVIGLVLTVSSTIHWMAVMKMWHDYPAPGEMVDVGGYKIHMLAEGEKQGNPAIVFIPGAHSPGIGFYNLHKIFRNQTKSILFDRPGSGWSDMGPYPRTSYREAEELHTMLERAGETDPVVLVGHSYGGLLAIVYALRYPENVAGLVLLDPGTAEIYQNPQAVSALNLMANMATIQGLALVFGAPRSMLENDGEVIKDLNANYERELGEMWEPFQSTNLAAKNVFSTISVLKEINDPEFFETGLIRDDVLHGVPVSIVTYLGGVDLDSQVARDFVADIRPDLDTEGVKEQLAGLGKTRDRLFALSDMVQSYSLPPGTTHNFPYEKPEFVTAMVKDILRRVRDKKAVPRLGAQLPHGWSEDVALTRELQAK